MILLRPFFGFCLLAIGADMSAAPAGGAFYVYVGTFTNTSSKGIYAYHFDAATGQLAPLGLVAEARNPAFLAVHPNQRFLYAANEIEDYEGQRAGSVTAYRIDAATGQLTRLNTVSSKGPGPCHVSVDPAGRNVLVANYGGGSVASLPIRPDGSLAEAASFVQHEGSGPDTRRQAGPHAHSINASPDNRFAIVADLGIDRLMVYRLDAGTGGLAPNDRPSAALAPGAGPRHFAFHPNRPFAYSINELNSTVTAFDWDAARGILKKKQAATTLPADFRGTNSTAEVVVDADGRFLYASNRGHDSIAVFEIGSGGTLKQVAITPLGLKSPRAFTIDPTGAFLLAAGQQSDRFAVFRVDRATGRISPTGAAGDVAAPVCIRFVPAPK